MRINKKPKEYVIGVDGGGKKTIAVLADLEGKILAREIANSSSIRNVGLKEAMENVALAIEKLLKKRKNISATFLGLPCMEEEFKFEKGEIERELLRHRGILPIFQGKLVIGSDQLAGFRSGIKEKEGICLIAGSGQVVHGWSKKREMKVSGWGYLTEKGSGNWIGGRALGATFAHLDGSGPRTLIKKLIFESLKVKDIKELLKRIYWQKNLKKQFEILTSFSQLTDSAAKRGDKAAKKILNEAAKELTKATKPVIKELNFQRKRFPLVLIGSVFKSKIILAKTKKEIKKIAPKVNFILPKHEPVIGAVKLAIEELSRHEHFKNLSQRFKQ